MTQQSHGKKKTQSRHDTVQFFAPVLLLGTQFAAGMAVLASIGWWLDKRHGGGLVFTLCGMFAGLLYGAYETWQTVRAINERAAAGRNKKGNSTP